MGRKKASVTRANDASEAAIIIRLANNLGIMSLIISIKFLLFLII